MARKLRFTAISFLVATALAQNPSPVVADNKNQSATTNNGVMIQNNITVAGPVKKSLQQHARADTGDEQGWLRLLTPANDPTPQSSCEIPDKSLAVFLGDSVGACSGNTCNILHDGGPNADVKNLLSVERKGSSLVVEGVVFGEDGKVVVSIEDDRPHVNRQTTFGWKRLDDHTLEVTDQKDRTVLHIRFMNKTTLYVEGLFYTPSGFGVKITKDTVQIKTKQGSNLSFHGGCQNIVGAGGSVFEFASAESPSSSNSGATADPTSAIGSGTHAGSPSQVMENSPGGIQAGHDITILGAAQPPRMLDPKDVAMAVEELKKVKGTMIMFLTFPTEVREGSEISNFEQSLEGVFRQGGFPTYRARNIHIGSVGFTSEGGSSHGEGIGCTITGQAAPEVSNAIVKALELLHYPCTAPAVYSGAPNISIYISVGTRLVPE